MLTARRRRWTAAQSLRSAAVRADSGANDTARAAGSTPTRQPCARAAALMGGPAAPRSYAEYKPRTETLRRARACMAARRATRCCARFGGRSRHRLPTRTKAGARTSNEDLPWLFACHHPRKNRGPLSDGRATSTRATPWCRPVACAAPRIGMEGEAPRFS